MKKLRLLCVAAAALMSAIVVSGATAHPGGLATCSGGPIAEGTYSGLVVSGNCWFTGDSITINGNVFVVHGGVLNDHAATPTGGPLPNTVVITGSIYVQPGGILGLGTYNPTSTQTTTVGGSIIANQPLSLYISFTTIHGSLISTGGGGGVHGEFRNFPTKDNTIGGNLIMAGWTGGWIGAFRNHVGGTLIFSHNRSVLTMDAHGNVSVGTDPDSSEVATNVIGGDLICWANNPPAQIGDSGGSLNTVGGQKVGQCTQV